MVPVIRRKIVSGHGVVERGASYRPYGGRDGWNEENIIRDTV
jgi:hypothetical protein